MEFDLEWDHILPLHSKCKGVEQKYQCLCTVCHSEKTALQGKQNRTLVSRPSRHVWQNYIETERPPPFAWSPHCLDGKHLETAVIPNLCEVDVIRCRRNALLHCPYELPVLSPFDNIVRAQPGHLADFNFVELSRRGKYSVLTLIPYVGPMWYHRCSVEHMLHYGIASWDDVKWQLSASGRLPHDILVEPLLEIERAWGVRHASRKI